MLARLYRILAPAFAAQTQGPPAGLLTRNHSGEWRTLRSMDGEFPAEPLGAAVVVGVGEQAADDNVGIGDIALASHILEVAAEAGEGIEAEAGLDDAPDDVGGFGRALGGPSGRRRIRRWVGV